MKNVILLFVFFAIVSSCTESKKKSNFDVAESSFLNQNIDSLLNIALNQGSKKAFDNAALLLDYYDDMDRLFFASIIMANKYNYSKAYYRAFMCLKEGFDTNYSKIELNNDLNFSFAKYYLLKAKEIEKKDEDLIFSINVELKTSFKEYPLLPNSEDYLLSELKKRKTLQ
ncbi:hypothetical protein [Lacihabitans soyangensis]|uniref:Uncharacterized protein n=1 Tax=Lacihabitans soyangensis TaxID=869394 RepID=A0AAE3H1A1_9BACT|nr:hypothetical protein [Lacihabitans soyangensis]MCP9763063.1 hypothetical protein [Lacihabitans soyangensis]MCP9764157.1 hypothetical protein [Lacihabitans soyangensis]